MHRGSTLGRGTALAVALAAALIGPSAATAATPPLVGHWTFEPGEETVDQTGNFDPLTVVGATISGGQLDVDNNSTWAYARGYTGPLIREKTLVSWASMDSLSVRSGSILTIDNIVGDNFDAIVYAERVALRWMAGSSGFRRTQDVVNVDETVTGQVLQLAISYEDLGANNVRITICREGVQIGQYTSGNMTQWVAENTEAIFGRRHTGSGTSGPGQIDAKIEEARIYGGVMTCDEVGALTVGCSDNDNDGFSPEGGDCGPVDCDDNAADTFPGAAPNDSATACMKDTDDDDWGDNNPPGGVTAGTDCDDNDATINPGAAEILCDAIDQNCNGLTDDDVNADGDPVSFCNGDCDDNAADTYPGAAPKDSATACMKDTDDDDWGDDNPPGGVTAGTDCDDADAGANRDDADNDNVTTCDAPADCNDNDPDIFPGNPEFCDGKDNDCNGTVDDGLTGGSASCIDVTQVLCYNRSTRRRVTLTAPGPDWDCAAGGLALSPGQRLTQYIYGTAQASCSPVGGAVCGVTPKYLQCLNLDNGTRGYPPVAGGWDCEAAGMIVSDGQRVRMTADGTVD